MKSDKDIYFTKILKFVESQTGVDSAILETESDLLGAGIIDSITAVSIIAFGEEEFGLEIDIGNIPQDAFRTISAIASLFRRG